MYLKNELTHYPMARSPYAEHVNGRMKSSEETAVEPSSTLNMTTISITMALPRKNT